jgi:hypothetical protein
MKLAKRVGNCYFECFAIGSNYRLTWIVAKQRSVERQTAEIRGLTKTQRCWVRYSSCWAKRRMAMWIVAR